ncbi:hypothetical protein ABIA39_008904 [Nocardia sp. GAS34]
MICSAFTAHHHQWNADADAEQCPPWQKPAVHDGYGYVQILYAPRRGHKPATRLRRSAGYTGCAPSSVSRNAQVKRLPWHESPKETQNMGNQASNPPKFRTGRPRSNPPATSTGRQSLSPAPQRDAHLPHHRRTEPRKTRSARRPPFLAGQRPRADRRPIRPTRPHHRRLRHPSRPGTPARPTRVPPCRQDRPHCSQPPAKFSTRPHANPGRHTDNSHPDSGSALPQLRSHASESLAPAAVLLTALSDRSIPVVNGGYYECERPAVPASQVRNSRAWSRLSTWTNGLTPAA